MPRTVKKKTQSGRSMPSTDDNDQVNPVLDSDMKLMLRTFI